MPWIRGLDIWSAPGIVAQRRRVWKDRHVEGVRQRGERSVEGEQVHRDVPISVLASEGKKKSGFGETELDARPIPERFGSSLEYLFRRLNLVRVAPLDASVTYADWRVRYLLHKSHSFFRGSFVSNLREDFYKLVDTSGEHGSRPAKVVQPVDYFLTLSRPDTSEPRKQRLFSEEHDDNSPSGRKENSVGMVS